MQALRLILPSLPFQFEGRFGLLLKNLQYSRACLISFFGCGGGFAEPYPPKNKNFNRPRGYSLKVKSMAYIWCAINNANCWFI